MYYDPKLPKISKDQLTLREQRVSGILKKIFNDYDDIFGKHGAKLFLNKRSDYLPLFWNEYNPRKEAFRFMEMYDAQPRTIKVTGDSPTFRFGRRRVLGKDGDINEGFKKGFIEPKEIRDMINWLDTNSKSL